jgi:hypothetical protein
VLIPEARVTVSRANFELSEPLTDEQHYCAQVPFVILRLGTEDCSIIHTYPPSPFHPQPNFAISTNRIDRRTLSFK